MPGLVETPEIQPIPVKGSGQLPVAEVCSRTDALPESAGFQTGAQLSHHPVESSLRFRWFRKAANSDQHTFMALFGNETANHHKALPGKHDVDD